MPKHRNIESTKQTDNLPQTKCLNLIPEKGMGVDVEGRKFLQVKWAYGDKFA